MAEVEVQTDLVAKDAVARTTLGFLASGKYSLCLTRFSLGFRYSQMETDTRLAVTTPEPGT